MEGPGGDQFWARLREGSENAREVPADLQGFNARLKASAERERADLLLNLLLEEVGKLLGAPVDPAQASSTVFSRIGVDSRRVVELVSLLSQAVGVEVPPTVVFDFPTPEALASVVARQLFDAASPEAPARPPPGLATRGRRGMGGSQAVAIVGAGCRFPGGVASVEQLWDLLCSGKEAVSEVPAERWDVDALFDADPEVPGKTTTRRGGFLQGVDMFDAAFFGIAPREAASMDPQQRLLLECAWEALERGGAAGRSLEGSRTGAFVGIFTNDYQLMQARDPLAIDTYFGTGTSSSVAAGRLSYSLGLHGPAILGLVALRTFLSKRQPGQGAKMMVR